MWTDKFPREIEDFATIWLPSLLIYTNSTYAKCFSSAASLTCTHLITVIFYQNIFEQSC